MTNCREFDNGNARRDVVVGKIAAIREKKRWVQEVSTRIKKESDQKQETKWKRGANRERGRQREKGNMLEETCATRSIHVTERKKYQKEFIRENVQHIAFMREEKCGRKYAVYTVFACMCEQGKTRAQKTKYVRAKERCRKKMKKKGKYQGSGSKVFQPHECFLSPALSQQGEERERRAINKNPHRELHIPRDAYRCIFVFLMGNV